MTNYKKVKIIICLFLMVTLTVVNAEAYQRHLDNFQNEYKYITYDYEDEAEWISFCTNIREMSKLYNVDIFSVVGMFESFEEYHLKVYGDKKMQETFSDVYEIFPGTYKSIVSGESIVEFYEISEMENNHYIRNIYFHGAQDDIIKLYNKISVLYSISGLNESESDSHDVIVRFAWIIAGVFIVLLTIFDIAFQKKEIYIKLVLGQSTWNIILKNIILDAISMVAIFAIVNSVIGQYTYVSYNLSENIKLFIAVIIVNSLIYLYMFRYSIKEALSNGNFSESLCGTCYIIKAILMSIALLSLSINVIGIKNAIQFYEQYKEVEKYKDYSYLELNYYELEDEVLENYDKYRDLLYIDSYDRYEVAYSVSTYNGLYDGEFLLINSNASDTISQLLCNHNIDENVKAHIFIPSKCLGNDQYIEAALMCVGFLGVNCEESYEVIYYDEEVDILYFDEDLMYSSDYAHNPIISYCTYSYADFTEESKAELNIGHIKRNLMYKVSEEDVEFLTKKYDLESKGLYLTCTNVTERYMQYKMKLEKTNITSCMISGLLLMLELGIIATIIRLEYSVNAVELAVKKIMGYRIMKKNKTIFWNVLLSGFIGIALLFCIVVLFDLAEPYLIIIVGGLFMLMELLVVFYFIRKYEKANIVKILKGGAL